MKRGFWLAWIAVALMVALHAPLLHGAPAQTATAGILVSANEMSVVSPSGAPTAEAGHPTLNVKDAPVEDVLRMAAKAGGFDLVLAGIPKDLRVSLEVNDLNPEQIIDAVCKSTGLSCIKISPKIYAITGNAMVDVSGSRVPVVGAITMSAPSMDYITGGAAAPYMTAEPSGVELAAIRSAMPMGFDGGDKLVDLEVKDAPIREVMAKLSAATGFRIEVAEPVSDQLKVTARIYRMPIADVLSMIVGQANLTYTVSYGVDENAKRRYDAGLIAIQEYESSRGKAEIHIVPRPELTVTGPGVSSSLLQTFWTRRPPQAAAELQKLNALRHRASSLVAPSSSLHAPTTCPKCKHRITQPGCKFCPECGAKLPASPKAKEKANKP